MFKAYPNYLRKCLNLCIGEDGEVNQGYIYSRSAFNEYGNIAYERTENIYEFSKVAPPLISDGTIQRINELDQWLQERKHSIMDTT